MANESTEYEKVLPELVRISMESGVAFEKVREKYSSIKITGTDSNMAIETVRIMCGLLGTEENPENAGSIDIPKLPNLHFIPLDIYAEDELITELDVHNGENPTRLVWMRYKYRDEDEWIYDVEACYIDINHNNIIWLCDWYDGQKYVEYLAVSWYDPLY